MSLSGSTAAATITRQAALSRTRRARWRLAPLFPGRTDAGYGAAHGGATHREPRHDLYIVAALLKGEVGTFFEIGAKEAPCLLVELRSRSGPLLRSQRFSPAGFVGVSLDRGETHGEGAGRLSFGHPAFYGGDYPSSEVFGVTAHVRSEER